MRFSEKLRHQRHLPCRFLIAAMLFVAVAAHGQARSPDLSKIYYNGNIITYSRTDGPEVSGTAAAVGVDPLGRIAHVGTLENVRAKLKADHPSACCWEFDLDGKTLLPGFFDGHSHFVQVAYLPTFADMLPPPDGPVTTIQGIQESLVAHGRAHPEIRVKIGDKAWKVVLGNGYDDSRLSPQGHPTRGDLDAVSDALGGKGNEDILVCVFHQSGHYSVCNSAALNAAGYHDKTETTEATKDPTGGTIYRDGPDAPKMTGRLGEKAHITMLMTVVPPIEDQTLIDGLELYTSQGFTTVEDGRVSPDILSRLSSLSKDFSVDVVAYPDLQMVYEKRAAGLPKISRVYEKGSHYRTGGVKLSLDGSPQGRSAWLTAPYTRSPNDDKNYRGEGNIKDAVLKDLLVWAYEREWQVLMHANGDATIDQVIDMEEEAQKKVRATREEQKLPPLSPDRRTVLIHGQFLRDASMNKNMRDQIRALDDLGIFPSLFPMHTFYWGDWYLDIVGKERAHFISPTMAVQRREMMFSIHSDAPVTKPNSMRLLDSAVNRTTRNGVVLGEGQRISPIVALKAMTIWPAYQHFEEAAKGSVEAGKNADFVILSHDPLTVSREKLICLQILQTIKDGDTVYVNQDTPEQRGQKFEACGKQRAMPAKQKPAA